MHVHGVWCTCDYVLLYMCFIGIHDVLFFLFSLSLSLSLWVKGIWHVGYCVYYYYLMKDTVMRWG